MSEHWGGRLAATLDRLAGRAARPGAARAEFNRRLAIAIEAARSSAAAQRVEEPSLDDIAQLRQRVCDELGLDEPP